MSEKGEKENLPSNEKAGGNPPSSTEGQTNPQAPAEEEKDYWVPLESNPLMLTQFARKLGVPDNWAFSDVMGLDEELLAFVPQPVLAVILLAPYSKMKAFRIADEAELQAQGQQISPNVYFMKQLVGNACGTVAVVHSLANNVAGLSLQPGFFQDFLTKTKTSSPYDRGYSFGKEKQLAAVHQTLASDTSLAQTEAPEADADVDFHFTTFVHVDGALYELDGARGNAFNHGPTTPATLLQDAGRVIQTKYLTRLADDLHFAVIALGPTPDD